MLFPFVIEQDAMYDATGTNQLRQLNRIHEVILHTWSTAGILIGQQNDLLSTNFWQIVNRMPDSIRKKYQDAHRQKRLRYRKVESVESAFPRINHVNDLQTVVSKAEVVALEEDTFELLALEQNHQLSAKIFNQALEIVPVLSLREAEAYRDAIAARGNDIPSGTPTAQVWRNWFRPIAEFGSHISIVDRYAGRNLLNAINNGTDSHNGLASFLRHLNDATTKSNVKIYTAIEIKSQYYEINQNLQILARQRGGIRFLELIVADDGDFARLSHDRYFRFDDIRLSVGTGVEVFNGEQVFRNSQYSMQIVDASHQCHQTESRLLAAHRRMFDRG